MSLQELAPFNISVRPGDGAVVLDADGDFDLAEVETFQACLDGVIASCDDAVVVDLTGVTFIDSSAISALLNARRRLAGEGRELRVEHLTGPVARVLELAGLTKILADTAMPDVDEG